MSFSNDFENAKNVLNLRPYFISGWARNDKLSFDLWTCKLYG